MSDMKCPFCQDTLIPCIKNQNDWIYHCDNQKCPMYDDADNENAKHLLASKDLWQELIRTRKALDGALNAIESAKDHNVVNCVTRGVSLSTDDVHITLYKALDEIKTALEQKEHFADASKMINKRM